MELLLGAGASRIKKVRAPDSPAEWRNLVTLDINPDHEPDVVWDCALLPRGDRLPWPDETFDEIHAYDVLEHWGRPGDWRGWFNEWSEFYRLLKPGGTVCGISPRYDGRWAWGDPGHCRIIQAENFVYLDQEQYRIQVGKTAITDYRFVWKGDFETVGCERAPGGETFAFVLRAIKPARIGSTT